MSEMIGTEVPHYRHDNVVVVTRDGNNEAYFDGKVKTLVYNSDTMEWEAATGSAAASEVSVSNFPANPSTSTLQGTANTKLDSLLTELQLKADLNETQPVSVSGVSTAANQTSANTKLDNLLTELQLKADLTETQPVSVSGGATSAKQDTGNTSVASIDTKTPALGQAAMAASSPVVIASNQTAVPVSFTQPSLVAGTALIGKVGIDQTTPGTTNKVSIGTDGTVALNAAVPAGTNLIGKFGIDQTTPGTTNAVQANAGTNLNTSLLNLESTQTAMSAKLPASLGAKNAAGSFSVVPTSDGFAVTNTNLDVALSTRLKPADTLTGVTTVGTVTAVTSITNALPAGTNRIGSARLVDSSDADLTAVVGTQTTRAVSVQEQKDAGRTHINFYAVAAASGTTGTETLITLTKSSGTSATSTGTSFVITSGKRFRITSFSVATRGNASATIQTTTFNFRVNTAGAVIASSTPVVLAARSATPATASAWDRFYIPIPDGYEILGNGTIQFGITAAATFVTNAPTWDVTITGFEY